MKTIARFLDIMAIVVIVVLVVATVLVAFVRVSDPANGMVCDGFGRTLSPIPTWVRLVTGEAGLWAGWGWLLVDGVGVLGGFAVVGGLFALAQRCRRLNGSR